MPNTPYTNDDQLRQEIELLSGSGAHACYCVRSTDGGCTCALKDEHIDTIMSLITADRERAVQQAILAEYKKNRRWFEKLAAYDDHPQTVMDEYDSVIDLLEAELSQQTKDKEGAS